MSFRERGFGLEVELPYWAASNYRVRVPALLGSAYLIWISVYLAELPAWLSLAVLPPLLLAILATFNRLRDQGRSGWWIVLMIMHFDVGLSFLGLPIPGVIINLIPVALV